jgi:hypothetical protein
LVGRLDVNYGTALERCETVSGTPLIEEHSARQSFRYLLKLVEGIWALWIGLVGVFWGLSSASMHTLSPHRAVSVIYGSDAGIEIQNPMDGQRRSSEFRERP